VGVFSRIGSILLMLAVFGAACSSGGLSSGTGGAPGSGGATGQGGTTGASDSGQPGSGGQTGTGGHVDSGTGGSGTGGSSTGGSSTGGQGGSAGVPGSGGGGGSGGTSAAGGAAGARAGASGNSGSGGTGGAGRAGSDGTSASGGAAGHGFGGSAGAAGANGATPSAGCGKTRTLQNGTITIQSSGARTYILRVPDNYDNSHPYRLILAYHWSGADASDVANSNYFRHWTMANNTTIFVAPEGLNQGWSNTNGADVTFTDAILAQVEGDLCVDTTRVFATGFSFGGGMCIALACARPDIFRAVAFFSGAELSGCAGGTMPIAYYASQASQDRGSLPADSPITGEAFEAKFAAINGCTPQNAPIPPLGSGQPHICTTYQGCSAGHPTEYCGFDGPHGWDPHDPGQTVGWDPEEAWKFITQF
jgi:poly(3-hydroxybutyrate) depolymerase